MSMSQLREIVKEKGLDISTCIHKKDVIDLCFYGNDPSETANPLVPEAAAQAPPPINHYPYPVTVHMF